jgi:hypothetical protein
MLSLWLVYISSLSPLDYLFCLEECFGFADGHTGAGAVLLQITAFLCQMNMLLNCLEIPTWAGIQHLLSQASQGRQVPVTPFVPGIPGKTSNSFHPSISSAAKDYSGKSVVAHTRLIQEMDHCDFYINLTASILGLFKKWTTVISILI